MEYFNPETDLELSLLASHNLLQSNTPPLLVDCREQQEFDYCRIQGAILVPLSQFEEKAEALLKSVETNVIIYCHHGVRSLHATQFLRARGFPHTFSMAQGIDGWSTQIDSSIPRY